MSAPAEAATPAEARALLAAERDGDKRHAMGLALIPRGEMSAAELAEWRAALAGRGRAISARDFDRVRDEAERAISAAKLRQERKDRMRNVGPDGAGKRYALRGSSDVFVAYPETGEDPARVTYLQSDGEDVREKLVMYGELSVPEVRLVSGITDDATVSAEGESTEYVVNYRSPNGSESSTTVDETELFVPVRKGEQRFTTRLKAGPFVERISSPIIDAAVRAFAAGDNGIPDPAEVYSSTGIARIDGRHVFLRNGRPALTGSGTDSAYRAHLPAAIFRDQTWARNLSYPDPSTPETAAEDAAALLAVIDAAPDSPVMGPVLCNLAGAPYSGLPNRRPIAVQLFADTGTGKGIVQAIVAGLQAGGLFVPTRENYDTTGLRFDAVTPASLPNLLHFPRGYVLTIFDVVQEGMTEKEKRDAMAKLNRAVREAAAPGSSGPKMQRNGVVARAERHARTSVLFDAEVPAGKDRAGMMARLVVVKMEGDPFRVREARNNGLMSRPELDAIYASLPAGSRALSAMIVETLRDLDENGTGPASILGRAKVWADETAGAWRIDGHARVTGTAPLVLAGAYLLGEHAGRTGVADPAEVRARLAETVREVTAAQAATSSRQSSTRRQHGRTVDVFRTALRRALLRGAILLAGPNSPDDAPAGMEAPGRSLAAYGWRRSLSVPGAWEPFPNIGSAIGSVQVYRGQGRRPKFALALRMLPSDWEELVTRVSELSKDSDLPDADVIAEDLRKAGKLLGPASGFLHWGNAKARTFTLDLGWVLAGDEDGQDEGPEDGGDPAEREPVDPEPVDGQAPAAEPPAALFGDAAAELVDGEEDEDEAPARPVDGGQDRAAAELAGAELGAAIRGELPEGWSRASAAGACVRCGVGPTFVRDEQGRPAHMACPAPQAAQERPEAPPEVDRPRRRRGPVVGDPAAVVDRAEELRHFAGLIAGGNGDLWAEVEAAEDSDAILSEALDLFHAATNGAAITSRSPGRNGQVILSWLTQAKGGQELERAEIPSELRRGAKLLDPSWVDPEQVPVIGGAPAVALDVNGQFLAAASGDFGIGEPVHLGRVDAGEIVRVPSFGRLAEPVTVPGILGRHSTVAAGSILAGPWLQYLAEDCGMSVPLSEAWIWEEHARWLAPLYELFRDARKTLADCEGLAATVARTAVKLIPNGFVSGWMRSEKSNPTATYRPDASQILVSRARANALRGIRKAKGRPVAVNTDTAYFLGIDQAEGMTIPERGSANYGQLGKWKIERVAPITDEIIRAHSSGIAHRFHRAAAISANATRGE